MSLRRQGLLRIYLRTLGEMLLQAPLVFLNESDLVNGSGEPTRSTIVVIAVSGYIQLHIERGSYEESGVSSFDWLTDSISFPPMLECTVLLRLIARQRTRR